MLEIYWILLIFGILFAVTTIVFGEFLGEIIDGVCDFIAGDHLEWLHPTLIVAWLTVFGGSGILVTYYTDFETPVVLVISLLAASIFCKIFYFIYVKPMRESENSIGVYRKDLMGKVGEVIVPLPADGYGEILIRAGMSNTNQIAASIDHVDLAAGCKVVVVDIKNGIFYVSQQIDLSEGEK